jgi:hypothetical protein
MRNFKRCIVSVAVAVAVVAAATASFANNNDKPYDARGDSRGSFEVDGVLFTGSSSSGATTPDGASSSSSSSALNVGGEDVGPSQSCSASSQAGDTGVSEDAKSDAGQTVADPAVPATVTLFGASCYAQAQSNNNSHTSADGVLARAVVPDAAAVTVGASHSDVDTTSGESESNGSFTGVSATAGDQNVTVLQCSAHSESSKDATSSSTDSTLVSSGDNSLAGPEDCPFASAESSYSPE